MPSRAHQQPLPRERVTTDLRLHGTTASRVQPGVGVWGPSLVPSTARKKVWRVVVPILFLLVLSGVLYYGWWFFDFMNKEMANG